MPTRSSPSRSLLPLSLLGTLACNPFGGAGEGQADSGGAGDGGGAVVHEQPCPDPTRATPPSDELCPPSREIAHLSADLPGCPAAPGWVVEELFTSESTPTAMTNTCRYIWPGPGAPPPLPPGLAGQTSADCRVSVQSPLEGSRWVHRARSPRTPFLRIADYALLGSTGRSR